jgi:hypothetical protein
MTPSPPPLTTPAASEPSKEATSAVAELYVNVELATTNEQVRAAERDAALIIDRHFAGLRAESDAIRAALARLGEDRDPESMRMTIEQIAAAVSEGGK